MAFDDTRWSLVLRAGTSSEEAREAMAALCQAYWPSLYSFLRVRGYSKDDASDLLQGFFLALLEKDWVSRARPEIGRFRTFLLTALVRYVSNESAKNRAQKRGGGIDFVRIDGDEAENLHQRIPSIVQTPEKLYDRQWAHQILERAMTDLARSYREAGKVEIFECLSPLMTISQVDGACDEAAAKLGMTSGAVHVALHRLKRRYREFIRLTVAETVASPDDVDDEVRHLIEALSSGR